MDQMPRHQEPLSIFREDEVDGMLAGIKDYLKEATRANTRSKDDDHPLKHGVYTVGESDVQGLLYCVFDLVDQVWEKRRPQDTVDMATETISSSPQAPRSMRPVASTTVDPATTITTSEASFTQAVGTGNGGRRRSQTTTTSTVMTQDNVTEITWLHPSGSAPAQVETILEHPSPGTPESTDQPKKVSTPSPPYPERRRSSADSRYSVPTNYGPGSSIGDNTRKRRQSSMVVFTGGNRLHAGRGPQPAEVSDQQPTTVFGMLRNKSVQFSQALGSFMNGAYQNADHKPRRDSSES